MIPIPTSYLETRKCPRWLCLVERLIRPRRRK